MVSIIGSELGMPTFTDYIAPFRDDARDHRCGLPERYSWRQRRILARIDAINLTRVKAWLALPTNHRGQAWDDERCERIEQRYKQFWKLCYLYPNVNHVPTSDIDIMWHHHILFTRQYADDCKQCLGYFLHHNPRDNSEEAKQALLNGYEVTKRLFKEVFNEELPAEHTGDCSPFPWC